MSTERPITVGSSDVPSILGLSRYRSQHETWLQLVGLMPRYQMAQADTEQDRGHLLEEALLLRWQRRNKRALIGNIVLRDDGNQLTAIYVTPLLETPSERAAPHYVSHFATCPQADEHRRPRNER